MPTDAASGATIRKPMRPSKYPNDRVGADGAYQPDLLCALTWA
jgi:hypothetical protein